MIENGQVAERSNAPDCKKLQRLIERWDGKIGEFRETLGIKNVKGNPEPSPAEKAGKVQRLSAYHLRAIAYGDEIVQALR